MYNNYSMWYDRTVGGDRTPPAEDEMPLVIALLLVVFIIGSLVSQDNCGRVL